MALRPLGFDPPLTRARVRTLTENRVYAIDRIRDAVGFRPEIGLDRGLADAIASYRAPGILA